MLKLDRVVIGRDSDAAVLMREARRLHQQLREPADARGFGDLEVPQLDCWRHDEAAIVAFSVLDKDPLPISELAFRLQKHVSQLPEVLATTRRVLGHAICLYATRGTKTQLPLSEAITDDGKVSGTFIAAGVVPAHRSTLASYLLKSLAAHVETLRRSKTKPGCSEVPHK